MMARTALSIMACEYGSLAFISTLGFGFLSLPVTSVRSSFSQIVIGTTILLVVGAPAGGFQQFLRCRRKASISLNDSWLEFAFGEPIPTLLLITSPVAAKRCGVRLSSSASTLRGSNFGCSFLGAGLASALASTFFSALVSGFFCSDFCSAFFGSAFARSFLIASAIKSRCGSAGFFSGVGGFGSG